ncbi:MAG: hypothetical protein ABSC62_15010 [Terracidiphilus sp.]|jgi:hypothetical protein
MFKECRHILPDGSRCHSAALKDMPYCYHHDRIHRALLRQRSTKAKLDLPALEDRASILMALSQVIGALADGRMDGTKAGRLIYGLQVASQFAPTSPRFPSSNQVESIARTSDGDELAPVSIKCFKNDDCDTCPYRDECGDEESGEEDEDADGDEEEDEDGDDDEDEDAGGEEEQEAGASVKVSSQDTA